MPNKRPYLSWFDSSLDIPIQQQGDDPAGLQFVPFATANKRTITGGDNLSYLVGDMTVSQRGTKSIIWSSEGYTSNLNVGVPALTAAQKKATGTHNTNIGGTAALDLSPYRNLTLMAVLTSFTGGASPSIQFELDVQDDAGTPNVLALWKPAALTAAGNWLVSVGPGVAFAQAAAAPSTAAAGFAAIAAAASYTYEGIALSFPPNGQIQWTVTGSPTAIAWTLILYGNA